jgi:hypothetical protein
MNTTVTSESVESAQREMDQAHEKYSAAHWSTAEKQTALEQVAQHLAALVARRRAVARSIEASMGNAVDALVADPKAKVNSPALIAARAEEGLLDSAIRAFQIDQHATVEREFLVAGLHELEAQLSFEELRLAHHKCKLAVLLGSAAELDGALELAPGDVSNQMSALVSDLHEKLGRARTALREFDRRVAASRAQQGQGL